MFRRALVLPLVLPLLALLPACEDSNLGVIQGDVAADELIDFGDVPNGLLAEKSVTITTMGGAPVQLTGVTPDAATFSSDLYVFEVSQETFTIAPGASKPLKVTFRAFSMMEMPVESSFVIKTDAKELTVRVKGRGVGPALRFDPDPVDFGNVLTGSSEQRDVMITNISGVPVDLKTVAGNDGMPELNITGNGRFEILSTVQSDGSLLAPGEKLAPNASITVRARYTPDFVATGREDRARWRVSYCSLDFCDQELKMVGNATANAVECMPALVDFGAVNPGRTVTRTVTCMNIANNPVQLLGWMLEGRDAGYYSTTPETSVQLLSGESRTIDVAFAPPMGSPLAVPLEALMRVDVSSIDNRPLDPVRVSLMGSAGGPTITVIPDRLSFGQVAVGTGLSKRVSVSNSGYTDLIVSTIDADSAMTGAYSATPLVFTLAVGTSTEVTVTFAPQAEGDFPSNLVVHSNDASTPEAIVSLSGQGVVLPPCSYSLQPMPVTFGGVTIGETADITVRFSNTGSDDCLINDLELVDAMNNTPTVFTLLNGPETGLRIAAGDTHDMPIRYAPTAVANDSAFLTFYVSDPLNSMPSIPLYGVGEASTQVTCPAPISVPAGTPIPLSLGILTNGTNVTSISWTIVSAPTGGIGTPNQWTPASQDQPMETFLAYIVGQYQLHVVVTDDLGNTADCDFIVTAEGHGLRVTMTWDGSGDVDLHLNENTSPWFGNPNDCYYGDRAPIWDAASPVSTGANPTLDFDNTSGFGPENTTIDSPVLNQVYTVGVHNYANAAGRIITLDILCGGVTSPTQTFVSNPLNGSSAGNCSANDFWKVATVEFTSVTTCVITPLNTYTASSNACIAY